MMMAMGAAVVGGVAAIGAAVAHGIFAPRSRLFCPVISSGDRAEPGRVALTFDDGPCPGSTERILDILEREGVQATFFVIGAYARRWPELVRRIDQAGHIVGNHSDSHHHWGAARHKPYWRAEMDRASDAIEAAIGRRPLLFRPPLGYKNWFMASAARERGLACVTWSSRGMDGVPTTPERIVRRVLGGAGPGGIIVLHDGVEPYGARDPAATIEALGPILAGLAERGLRCERLDRMIGVPAYAGGEAVRVAAGVP